jgi:hypothetical protein
MESYEFVLNAIKPELSFGSTKIHMYRPLEIKSGQVGYSVSRTGVSLTGDKKGDWRSTWLVIGYDENGGDPFFIDTAEEKYPVYRAIVGQGCWDPERIAITLSAFAEAFSLIVAASWGREHPVALEQNPFSEFEKDTILSTIRQGNPGIDIAFWENLLTNS